MTAFACVLLVCWLATLITVYTIRKEDREKAAEDAQVLERLKAIETKILVHQSSLAGLDPELMRVFREEMEARQLKGWGGR